MTKQQLLNTYYPAAVKATANTGLFPQTLITQLIEESGYNLSSLALQYNNFFGIKATPSWTGKVISKNTYEYLPNKVLITGTNKLYNNYLDAVRDGANKMSLFRVYPTYELGFKGYVNFLQTNLRYANVFKATTPEQQFYELQKAGYATSSTYANELLAVYNSIKDNLPRIAAVGGLGILIFAIVYLAIKQ
jgi:flagellum-specific peptidoglycan hydrolase FlgJ